MTDAERDARLKAFADALGHTGERGFDADGKDDARCFAEAEACANGR